MIFIRITELPGIDDLDFGFIFILFSENWFDADNDINKNLRKKNIFGTSLQCDWLWLWFVTQNIFTKKCPTIGYLLEQPAEANLTLNAPVLKIILEHLTKR